MTFLDNIINNAPCRGNPTNIIYNPYCFNQFLLVQTPQINTQPKHYYPIFPEPGRNMNQQKINLEKTNEKERKEKGTEQLNNYQQQEDPIDKFFAF